MVRARKTVTLDKAGAVVVEAELLLSDYVNGLVLATIPALGVSAYAYTIEVAEQRAFSEFAFKIAYLRRDGKLEHALNKAGVTWWWKADRPGELAIDAIDAVLHHTVEKAIDLVRHDGPVMQ